jgi:hypothetical protein
LNLSLDALRYGSQELQVRWTRKAVDRNAFHQAPHLPKVVGEVHQRQELAFELGSVPVRQDFKESLLGFQSFYADLPTKGQHIDPPQRHRGANHRAF